MESGWTSGIRGYCILVVAGICSLNAASRVTLAWDPSASTSVTGYHLYYGGGSGDYTNLVDTGNVTSATVSNLISSSTYFFAVTAYDAAGLESAFSGEVSYTVPGPTSSVSLRIDPSTGAVLTGTGPAGYGYTILTSADLLDWVPLASVSMDTNGFFQFIDPVGMTNPMRFYRLQQTSP